MGPTEVGVRELARRVAVEYPHLTPEEQAKMVAWRLHEMEPHDRLWYRIKTTRQFSASSRREVTRLH